MRLTIQRRNNLRMTVGLLTVLLAQIQLKLQNTTTKYGGHFAEKSAAQTVLGVAVLRAYEWASSEQLTRRRSVR
jgi:hypothetical protein